MTQVPEEDKTAHKIRKPWAEQKYLQGVKKLFPHQKILRSKMKPGRRIINMKHRIKKA